MRVGQIDLDERVLVIAEVGNNHEGDFELARTMVHAAADAGADAVKFQTIVPERLVSGDQTLRLQQLGRFRFSYDQFAELKETADAAGVVFLSTPFDLQSATFLDDLVPAFKIASGDNDFYPLLTAVARTGKPLLISAGLTDLAQVERTVGHVRGVWAEAGISGDLALLHCVVSYPTSPEDAHLAAIEELKAFDVVVGYSDHTLGIEAAVLAIGAGARVVEKHFTVDKDHSDFRDHQLSADPAELAEMVRRIREADVMMGRPGKGIVEAEAGNLTPVRRSIAAVRDIAAGETIAFDDLAWVRPGDGLRPGEEAMVVGRTVLRPIAAGHVIRPEDLADAVPGRG